MSDICPQITDYYAIKDNLNRYLGVTDNENDGLVTLYPNDMNELTKWRFERIETNLYHIRDEKWNQYLTAGMNADDGRCYLTKNFDELNTAGEWMLTKVSDNNYVFRNNRYNKYLANNPDSNDNNVYALANSSTWNILRLDCIFFNDYLATYGTDPDFQLNCCIGKYNGEKKEACDQLKMDGQNQKCDEFMTSFCNNNSGSEFCNCITSNIIYPQCLDKNCAENENSYKTMEMPMSSCEGKTYCNQVVNPEPVTTNVYSQTCPETSESTSVDDTINRNRILIFIILVSLFLIIAYIALKNYD